MDRDGVFCGMQAEKSLQAEKEVSETKQGISFHCCGAED